jgi:hypothetical protein
MNRQELRIRLLYLDKEREMVVSYLKYTQSHFAKTLYENALEYIDHQTNLILEQLENFQEKSYEH